MDALAGIDLGLPVQRQMIGIFRYQNLSDGGFGRQTALDQPGRSLGLHDALLTGATGVFGTPGEDNAELCWHHVQPLALVFADAMQFALAAEAGLVVDVDDDLDPRQMRRQRSAVDAALARPFGPVFQGRLVLTSLGRGCDLLDVLEAQQHLFLRKRLCFPAKAMTLQFLDDLTQPLALVPLGQQHCLQRLGIIREVVARHPQIRSYSPPFRDDLDAADSLRRSVAHNYPACVGTIVSRASWTRRQSSPSSSADNSAADKRITPSSILGQRKTPSSSLLANRHKPVPSQKISLIRSAHYVS
jgi:hypothetical protein